VVANLEQVYRTSPTAHFGLRSKSGIAREDGLEGTILHQQHQRILIQVLAPTRPLVGMENREADTVQGESFSPAPAMPGDRFSSELVEEFVIQRAR
jgi:hypothetical protein